MKSLKIGEVAKRAGVSIRTLHYYEEIGLLEPIMRTSSGHRLYGRDAIERLQQIKSLQQIGLSLSEADALFRGQGISPQEITTKHLARVQGQIKVLVQLEKQLQYLAKRLENDDTDDTEFVEFLLSTMKAMTMYDQFLTPEQQEAAKHKHEVADTAAQKEWDEALQDIRKEMDAGSPPNAKQVLQYIKRWQKASEAFLPSDDGTLYENVMKVFHNEPKALEEHGLDPVLFAFIEKALALDSHQ